MICLRKVSYVFIKVYYEENNVHLQGNATKNIFILAAILDFLEKQSQN